MTHPTREQILQAAARLYADHGFRGTTTRAIAEAAGVNEVTLFRIFGSKETLIVEAMREHGSTMHVGRLPERPVDPHAELAAWATQTRKVLVSMRSMLRQAMCDGEKSPEMSHCVARGADATFDALYAYLGRVQAHGFALRGADLRTASGMLMSAIFHDAVAREFTPHLFPPATTAPGTYSRLCLASIGCVAPAAHSMPVERAS